jgi:Tfp pilus assembly protein PilO
MTLPNRQIRLIAVFAAVNVLLIAVGWMTFVSPQRHDAATAAAAAKVAQDEFATLMGQGSHSGPVKQPHIHTAGLYALDTALPSQPDQANLLFELDRLAKASGVKILGFSPQAAQATAGGYTIVPINLQLDGSYYHVTGFLRTLRQLVSEQHGRLIAHGPLFAVTTVALSPGDAPATVQIQAYYYGVTAGATPPASPTDTTTTTGG